MIELFYWKNVKDIFLSQCQKNIDVNIPSQDDRYVEDYIGPEAKKKYEKAENEHKTIDIGELILTFNIFLFSKYELIQ